MADLDLGTSKALSQAIDRYRNYQKAKAHRLLEERRLLKKKRSPLLFFLKWTRI